MAKIILLNKPFNVLCQFSDKEGRATLSDFISESGVYPAGRLDYDSEGLVVLTDDGRLQHQISHPKHKLEKTYWVQVEGEPTSAQLDALGEGITLNDGPCRPARVKLIDGPDVWPRTPPVRFRKAIATTWLEFTISEGRNRQVRRMTAAVGCPTLRLIRVQIGQWSINGLESGQSLMQTVHAPNHKSSTGKRTPSRRSRL
jgi:23S rRNA pseudouridine2457 synthase